MPKNYQPGQRQRKFGENKRFSDTKKAWCITEAGKFFIIVGEDKGVGPDVLLYHPRPGKIPDLGISLTDLTHDELTALKELINTALEWAEPVVTQRDKEAEDAWNAGDDSHSRIYRPIPTVVYRAGPITEHSARLRERSERVSESRRREREDSQGGVRGAGSELAESDSPGDEPQDDSPSPD